MTVFYSSTIIMLMNFRTEKLFLTHINMIIPFSKFSLFVRFFRKKKNSKTETLRKATP